MNYTELGRGLSGRGITRWLDRQETGVRILDWTKNNLKIRYEQWWNLYIITIYNLILRSGMHLFVAKLALVYSNLMPMLICVLYLISV